MKISGESTTPVPETVGLGSTYIFLPSTKSGVSVLFTKPSITNKLQDAKWYGTPTVLPKLFPNVLDHCRKHNTDRGNHISHALVLPQTSALLQKCP